MTTAKETAYTRIRSEILSGHFLPGTQLRELELAQLCQVSRTPVRQAFSALADEGLVTIKANRRCYVSEVSETQFEEVFDLLAMLEGYSAGLAAMRNNENQIAALEELAGRMEKITTSYRDEDYRAFLDLNYQFHKAIHAASGNDKLEEMVGRIVNFPSSVCLKFGRINAQQMPATESQHRLIIDALKSGDREWARLEMARHAESVRRSFRQLWRDQRKSEVLET